MRLRTMILAAAAAALLALAPAASASQTFDIPVKLSNPPSGGEPSIAADPFGHVLVASPQGIPAAAGGNIGGTGLWVSKDDATTFAAGSLIGSALGGGDDDVIYDKGTWYEADLEAVATEVCSSTDTQTWTGTGPLPDPLNCQVVNGGQAAPSDDRPWLTADPTDAQRVYLTYHEFVTAQPLAFVTNNGGADGFSNSCGPIVTDPSIEANVPTDVTGGTLVARPVVDRQGNLYVLFATTTQAENAQAFSSGQPSGTFSQLYLAVSHDHCQSFTDSTVFDGSSVGTNTVQFGDIFNDLAVDGAGNLYVVGTGAIGTTPFPSTANTYLFSSTDHGQHWSRPAELSTPASATMLPAAVAGPQAGQLAIGYFRTINGKTDPNDSADKWTYSTAETTDAAAASPAFSYADVNPGYDYHNGEICNLGILCGSVPGQPSDRSLLDFTSATLDPSNCPLFVFAGNPTGSPGNNDSTNTNNFVARQLTGCFATSSSATTTATATPTHKKHKKKRKKHKLSRRPRRSAARRGFTG